MPYDDAPPEPSIISSRLRLRGIVPSQSSAGGAFPGLNDRPDAGSATVKDAGGAVLKHVQVVLVFWGSAWTGHPTPSRDDVTNAVINILTGPYMSGLAQYDGIGGGSLAASVTVQSPDPPAPFSLAQVQAMLSNQLTLNTLPRPTFSNQFLYCVIMPTGLLTSGAERYW